MSAWDIISGFIPGYDAIASGVNWARNIDWSGIGNSIGEANAAGQALDPINNKAPESASNNPPENNDKQLQSDIMKWTSIKDKPFKFNPPLHGRSRPVRTDFGSGWGSGGGDAAGVQKSMDDYLKDATVAPAENTSTFQAARLGRIVQSENAVGDPSNRGDYRWGFRFLYNPPELSTTTQANMVVRMDPTSDVTLLASSASNAGPFQSHSFSLLLNRIADLEADEVLAVDDYAPYPGVNEEDVAGILDRGTMWDLEYLFRVVNGMWNLEEVGNTGNMGLLQANPVFLVLGPGINHYGMVTDVQYRHIMFNAAMIPTATQVDIKFRRLLYLSPGSAQEFMTGLGVHGGKPKTAASGTSAPPAAPGGDPNAPIPASGASVPFQGDHPQGTGWTYSGGGGHYAQDFPMPIGTPLLAVRDGIILDCNDGVSNDGPHGSGSPSNWICLGVNWQGKDVTMLYQHLSPGLLVAKNQSVKAGQPIANSGNSGNSTGPHLHIAAMYGRKTASGRYDYMKNSGKNSEIIFPPSNVWYS